MNKTHDAFMEQFKSLETAFGEAPLDAGASLDAEALRAATKTIKRALWLIIILNLVLGLIRTALTVAVIGGVTLGLLKLFGVI
jgi:hypothetical protein